jgi:hypothetical protein
MRARVFIASFIAAGALATSSLGHGASAGAAEPDPAYVPPPPPPLPAAAPTAEQVDALQQRLLASQQTIATLERQLADAKNRAVAMEQCRVKNGRLVFIGRELIEGYARRYRETQKDPLQLGRRRFEFELQSLSEAVYDNRADVPVPLPGGKRQPEAPDTAPAGTASPSPRAKGK